MLDALGQFLGYLQYIWDFGMNMLSSVLKLLEILALALPYFTMITSMMPWIIGTGVCLFAAVAVIRFLSFH